MSILDIGIEFADYSYVDFYFLYLREAASSFVPVIRDRIVNILEESTSFSASKRNWYVDIRVIMSE